MGEVRTYLLTALTTVTLTLGGACYAQTNSAVTDLVASDKEQATTIAVLKEQISTLITTLREVRDDVKGIRNDIRDPGTR